MRSAAAVSTGELYAGMQTIRSQAAPIPRSAASQAASALQQSRPYRFPAASASAAAAAREWGPMVPQTPLASASSSVFSRAS